MIKSFFLFTRPLILLTALILISSSVNGQITDTLEAKEQMQEGLKLLNTGKFEAAIPIFEPVVAFYKKAALWNKYLNANMNLSMSYAESGRYEKAKLITDILINQSAELVAQPAEFEIEGYTTLGHILYLTSKFKESEVAYNQALEVATENFGLEHLQTADSYGDLGTLHEKMGDHQKSLNYNLKALEIREKLLDKDHADLGYSYSNIGLIYKKRNEPGKALGYYQKAETIMKANLGDRHPTVGIILNNIGRIYHERNQTEKALETYEEVLSIFMESLGENHPNIGLIKTNIGMVYLDASRFEEAGKEFQDSYDVWVQSLPEDHYYMGVYHNNMSLVYASRGDFEKALESLDKGIEILKLKLGPRHPELCVLFNNKAIFNTQLEKYDEAVIASNIAIDLNIVEGDNVDLIFKDASYTPSELLRTYFLKANIFLKQYEKTNDIQFVQEATKILSESENYINQRNKLYANPDDQIVFNGNANTCLKQATTAYLKLYQSSQDQSDFENIFRLTEESKSKVLLQSTNIVDASQYAGIPLEIIQEEKQIKENITLYERKVLDYAQANDSIKMVEFRNEKLFKEKQKLEDLVTILRKDYRAYHDMKYNTDVASIQEVQEVLDDKSLLVSYTLDRNSYDEYNFKDKLTLLIITVSKDKTNVTTVDWPEEFEKQAHSFYELIQKSSIVKTKNKATFIEQGHALYQKLIEPIKDQLNGKNRLVVIGEDILNYIPFEALLKNSKNRSFDKLDFMVKDFDISYHYSASLYLKSFKNQLAVDESNLLAFAPVFDNTSQNFIPANQQRYYSDSTYSAMRDNRFQPLYWSEKEVLAIYDLFQDKNQKNNKILLRDDASEEALKKNLSQHRGIVHIASHSFANIKAPKFSGIACTINGTEEGEDGILHVGEIYNIPLNADLVVLSSCESGLGQLIEGEGMLGINRSFLYAGARNVLYSLWKVNDKSSSELMVEFYQQLLNGKAYPQALRESKLKMLSQEATALPKYWAPFVLIGR